MRTLLPILIWLTAGSLPAQASDFRYCDMEGTVQSATLRPGRTPRDFELSVRVSAASRQQGKLGKESYTDCSEYAGETVRAFLEIPERYGEPTAGDRLSFSYTAIDGFGGGQYAGTSITTELHSYEKPAGADNAGQ